ncbi:MAG: site-specific integrase [Opitutaceae bacterium]|jgi:integrase|nr:site-specific integrase [Opitutaceae bacterium]
MASLTKKERSPFWFACYTSPDGRRTKRSTKQTDRRKAQAMAEQFERAAKLAAQKRLGEAQARRVLGDIYETVSGGERLLSSTAKDFLTGWAESRKVDTSQRTHAAYAQVARDFIESLGARAEMDISQVSKADVAKFRDSIARRASAASANKAVKFLRVALGRAHKDGFSQDNPAAKVDVLKRDRESRAARRAFTLKELGLLINAASDEWRRIILFGLYTGQRLGDLCRLTWQNLDVEKNELRFVTAKTGRNMVIPLAASLVSLLADMDGGDSASAPLFPAAHDTFAKAGNAAPLSKQFHALLVSVGLAPEWENKGVGRNGARELNAVSFHSLRHTATSLLKNAGVSEIVARDIIGHNSEAVSRNYSHVDEDAKRRALAALPDLLSPQSRSGKLP